MVWGPGGGPAWHFIIIDIDDDNVVFSYLELVDIPYWSYLVYPSVREQFWLQSIGGSTVQPVQTINYWIVITDKLTEKERSNIEAAEAAFNSLYTVRWPNVQYNNGIWNNSS